MKTGGQKNTYEYLSVEEFTSTKVSRHHCLCIYFNKMSFFKYCLSVFTSNTVKEKKILCSKTKLSEAVLALKTFCLESYKSYLMCFSQK